MSTTCTTRSEAVVVGSVRPRSGVVAGCLVFAAHKHTDMHTRRRDKRGQCVGSSSSFASAVLGCCNIHTDSTATMRGRQKTGGWVRVLPLLSLSLAQNHGCVINCSSAQTAERSRWCTLSIIRLSHTVSFVVWLSGCVACQSVCIPRR